jgi:hypothetical protein
MGPWTGELIMPKEPKKVSIADKHSEYKDIVSRRQKQIDEAENEQRVAMGLPPKVKAPPPPKK